jgi:hypothetical protein
MSQIDDDDDLPSGDEKPQPQTSLITIALCVLNIAAVLAFAYLLIMDLSTRQRWMRLAFMHDFAIQGLPLLEEDDQPSAAHSLAPPTTLEPDWLKEAYLARKGVKVKEAFRPAELEMQRIRTKDLSEEFLKEVFKGRGKPIGSLDEELVQLRADLPKKIDSATEGAAAKAKTEQDKRNLLYFYLLPMANLSGGVDQTVEVDLAIQAIPPKKLAALDALIVDAAKRKLLVDLLTRLEEFRPQDPALSHNVLRRAVALRPAKGGPAPLSTARYKVSTDDLMEQLNQRVDETLAKKDWKDRDQHDIEKRRRMAFLLYTLSRFKGGDGSPLYSPERAEVVSGIREFTQAADTTALILQRLQKRLLTAIVLDRGPSFYPLDYRVHDPKQFARAVTQLLVTMQVFPDWKDKDAKADAVKRRKAFEKGVEKMFTDELGKIRSDEKGTAAEKALAKVKEVMKDQGVGIPEDPADVKLKVREAQFDQAVLQIVDSTEPGFVGRHHDLIKRIADLSARIRQMDHRLKEIEAQEDTARKEYKVRQEHFASVAAKVVEQREQTLRIAEGLAQLQHERFRAQLELSNADRDNRIMERRIRALEQSRKWRGKGAQR